MIHINESELQRAGFPRSFIAALRQIASISNSTATQADIYNLQSQITMADAEILSVEVLVAMNRLRSQLTDIESAVSSLRAEIASQRKPNLSSIERRIDAIETIVNGTL